MICGEIMNFLADMYNGLFAQYNNFINAMPSVWVTIVYFAFIVAGIFVANANRDKCNFLLWFIPVLLFPVIGTLVVIAAAIVFKVRKLRVIRIYLQKRMFIVPAIAYIIFGLLESVLGSFYNDALPLSMLFTVMMIMCMYIYRKSRKTPIYIRALKKDADMSRKVVYKDNYSYNYIEGEGELTSEIVESIGFGYCFMTHSKGEQGFQYNSTDDKYLYDVFYEFEYLERFDVKKTKTMKGGIEKITALDWQHSDDFGVILRTGHHMPLDTYYPETYQHYNSDVSVTQVVLYRYVYPIWRVITAYAMVMATAILFLSPIGIAVHTAVMSLIQNIVQSFI